MALRRQLGRRIELKIHRRNARGGFILLLVVLIILLFAMVASAIATRAMASVAEARRLEDQLRDRWARISLERALLNRADACFQRQEDVKNSKTNINGYIDGEFVISGKQYRVRLADEQAKVNVLRGIRDGKSKKAFAVAARLGAKLRPELEGGLARKIDGSVSEDLIWPVRNWEVMLDQVDSSSLEALQEQMLQTSQVTLWGSGQLNWKRSTPEAIKAQAELHGIDGPITEGRKPPVLVDSHEVRVHFSERSESFSLWIFPRTPQAMVSFTVEWSNGGSVKEREGFAW